MPPIDPSTAQPPGAPISAAEADAIQRRVAAGLSAMGFGPGDRFAVVSESIPEVVHVVMGALRAAVMPVVVNSGLLADERAAILDNAEVGAVFDETELRALCAWPTHDPKLGFWPLGRPVFYTSGTSGTPKGVYSGVLDPSTARDLWCEEIDLWSLGPGDRYLQLGPLHHSAPLRFAMFTLLAGGSIVVPGHFDPLVAAEAIERWRPTFTFAAPVHLQRLFASGSGSEPDLSCFRRVAHAGAPCPASVKAEALARFPAGSVWEFYGSTEGQFTVCSPEDHQSAPGSVGRARPGRRLRIADDGTIWCTVPNHARFEYWRDPAKTAAAWKGDEFSVGDLGRLDGPFLYLDGRRDDLIITGGVNVYPLEVENALRRDPRIDDVAVFGVSDPQWGQAVWAAVVGSADVSELTLLATEVLAPFKRPKGWVRVPAIPTTPSGKVRRHDLARVLGVSAAQS